MPLLTYSSSEEGAKQQRFTQITRNLKTVRQGFIFSSKQYIFFPQFHKMFSTLGNTYNPSFSKIEKGKAKETDLSAAQT